MNLWKWTTLLLSSLIILLLGVASYFAMHSDLFTLRVVEVDFGAEKFDPEAKLPITVADIHQAAAVKVNQENLFALSLSSLEQRLLQLPWVEEVELSKMLPQTLKISVRVKEAVALLQNGKGTLHYLDGQGQIIEEFSLHTVKDLPVVNHVAAMDFIQAWNQIGGLSVGAALASLSWDANKGLGAWLVYGKKADGRWENRVFLQVGRASRQDFRLIASRVHKVLEYLSKHSIAARQLLIGEGQKIVVSTPRVS